MNVIETLSRAEAVIDLLRVNLAGDFCAALPSNKGQTLIEARQDSGVAACELVAHLIRDARRRNETESTRAPGFVIDICNLNATISRVSDRALPDPGRPRPVRRMAGAACRSARTCFHPGACGTHGGRRFRQLQPVGAGVWEARIDYGPGYRVYYARAGDRLILLLIGGDKRKQQADIESAAHYWKDWQERSRK